MPNSKTLQSVIVKRFMSKEEFAEFISKYETARVRPGGGKGLGSIGRPSATQIYLATLSKDFGIAGAMERSGAPRSVVRSSINRVASYEFLTKESIANSSITTGGFSTMQSRSNRIK